MKFAAVIDYKADNPKVAEVRPAHRKYLGELKEKGKLVISGPFPETGGALIVYEAGSKDEAEALIKADPFTTGGVFTSWVIRSWNPIFINRDLLPD
jgi:uncharacterized protein YciI